METRRGLVGTKVELEGLGPQRGGSQNQKRESHAAIIPELPLEGDAQGVAVGLDHFVDEVVEADAVIPAEFLASFGGVA